MSTIPDDPQALLTRQQLAVALTDAGFPIAVTTLSTKASRGSGPPFQRFGYRPLYRWGAALEWAQGRLSRPVHSTAELELEAG